MRKEKKIDLLYPMVPIDRKIIGMPILRDPDLVVEEAKKAAKAMVGVLDDKPRKVIINDRRYLEFEDWQLLGGFYGVTARVKETSIIKDNKKKFIGFLAKAEALKGGEVISGAEAECLTYEKNWRYKAFNQRFMLRSMAQTRACAKALRNCLAWIVVLAGYAATPAEEMGDVVEGEVVKNLPDNLYKTIKRRLRKKGIKPKSLRKFLRKKFDVVRVEDLSKEEGEKFLAAIDKI